jgi:hypothetical protein
MKNSLIAAFCLSIVAINPVQSQVGELGERNNVPTWPTSERLTISQRDTSTNKHSYSDEELIRAQIISLKKEIGRITLTIEYENLMHVDRRYAVYNGGANGRDTLLLDDNGNTWEMLKRYKGGGEGMRRKLFRPGKPVKVTLIFSKESGDISANTFDLVNWVHILSPVGATSDPKWVKVEIAGIPVGYSSVP